MLPVSSLTSRAIWGVLVPRRRSETGTLGSSRIYGLTLRDTCSVFRGRLITGKSDIRCSGKTRLSFNVTDFKIIISTSSSDVYELVYK